MAKENPFKGAITIIESGSGFKNMKFDATPSSNAPITKTLMIHFKDIQLSEAEKRYLTRHYREFLYYFANMAVHTIESYSQKLVEKVAKSKHRKLKIKADDFGVFICLGAFMSGRLPEDKKITFIMGNAPLVFFPKKLVSRKFKSGDVCEYHQIEFQNSSDSWLSPFQTLREVPEYLMKSDLVDLSA